MTDTTRRRIDPNRLLMIAYAVIYLLVVLAQLAHVHAAYADADRPGRLYSFTSWAQTAGFELSILVFTYRIITCKARWTTRAALTFFVVASMVANATYYQLLPVFSRAMPWFAAVALPISMAIFASEFSATARAQTAAAEREERKAQRQAAAPAPQPAAPPRYVCRSCGREFGSPAALNAHGPLQCAARRQPALAAGATGGGNGHHR